MILHSGVSEQHRIVPSSPLLTPAVCSSIFGSGKYDGNLLIAVVRLDSRWELNARISMGGSRKVHIFIAQVFSDMGLTSYVGKLHVFSLVPTDVDKSLRPRGHCARAKISSLPFVSRGRPDARGHGVFRMRRQ